MKEHPILFSGPMVRAILDGRKTQTRRIVKPQPNGALFKDGNTWVERWFHSGADDREVTCPYGAPGYRLWVKETWAKDELMPPLGIRYAATDDISEHRKKRPSIFMPRWASRITLEIVSVRVERVQDISEGDAKAEGVEKTRWGDNDWVPVFNTPRGQYIPKLEAESHLAGFFGIWETINAQRGYGWDANPWVWVIEFKRLEGGAE